MNHEINRRDFVRLSGAGLAAGLTGWPQVPAEGRLPVPIKVARTDSTFEREHLFPYHFKGSAIKEAWQVASCIETANGVKKIGLCTQSPLWSDASVYAEHSVAGGNAIMYAMTEEALKLLRGKTFSNPLTLLDELLPEILDYGKKITGNSHLKKTFALNALVSVDNAVWLLYAAENNIKSFDDMIPGPYKPGLSYRHQKVASMPSFSAGSDVQKIKAAADQGYFMLKLKIGAAGTQQEMLQKDMEFITAVHKAIGHYETPYTKSGKIPYYFDANERYDKKETLMRFIDHAKAIGAFNQIALIEEPFGERNPDFVGDLGLTIAADESAHTVEDAATRIEQGYGAIALKAVAKTLSMTMKIAQLAFEKKVPCFCADLTVNPILVEWNKNIAARLQPFPGISTGLLENNGRQYYKNWETMSSYHPMKNAAWVNAEKGVFNLDNSFYTDSGGIFRPPLHYETLFSDQE